MESTWGENTSFRKNYGIYFNDFIPLLIFSVISLFVDLSRYTFWDAMIIVVGVVAPGTLVIP